MSVEIPKAGRIGRFAEILEKEAGKEVLQKVMKGADKYEKSSSAEKAAWWRGTAQRMEETVGKEKAVKVMEDCGRKCCGAAVRKLGEKYWKESKSMEEFLENLNKGHSVGGRLKLKDEHTIVGGYDKCYCAQVNKTKERFPSDTYCQCGAAWLNQFFESALGRPVKVKLKQSVIQGAKTCEFEILV